MERELTAWKSILQNIYYKLDGLPGHEKGPIFPNIEDIHILLEQLDERIGSVQESCTPEIGMDDVNTEQQNINLGLSKVPMQTEYAMQVLGAGSFGG
jgi:hypothetical protein